MFSYNSNNAKDEDLCQQKVLNTNAEKLLKPKCGYYQHYLQD